MRFDHWPETLDYYIRSTSENPYKMGIFDCVSFVAKAMKHITGKDILDEIDYTDEKTGLKLLKKHDGLFKLADKQFNKVDILPYKNKNYCKRGDIVGFMTAAHGETLGICTGSEFVSPGKSELVYLPMADVVRAWEVR